VKPAAPDSIQETHVAALHMLCRALEAAIDRAA
jgi:hypothetical protein